MIIRFVSVAALALTCAACANDASMQPMRLGVHGDAAHAPADRKARKSIDTANPSRTPHGETIKQTLGGKVLSAIALERVTGRKPDPRRFKELR